ncbi:MAG: ubiquinol-cytochrome C chaperone [Beijerinckiaceae bacterium]|jgi:cytochrome b pre-mRNA-processing protein 3|nr:ubiquinol-cytochrome C chaperone [Beijerinckiaceae bacterium]
MAFFGLFGRRRKNRDVIERLYKAVVEQSRSVTFYQTIGVPDTLEGRFELLTLHMTLISRRLKALPSPGPDMSQDLVDLTFAQFETALREIGVGDISIPKRMKVMASAYLGRASAYDEALRKNEAGLLAEALARNLFGNAEKPSNAVEKVTNYVIQSSQALENAVIGDFYSAKLPFFAVIDED